jgi:hypothetical protein
VHWSAAYAAWGKTSERQYRVANPLRLQGQYADEETERHALVEFVQVLHRDVEDPPISCRGSLKRCNNVRGQRAR